LGKRAFLSLSALFLFLFGVYVPCWGKPVILVFPSKPRAGDAAVVMVKGVPSHGTLMLEGVFFKKNGSEKREFRLRSHQGYATSLVGIGLGFRSAIFRVKTRNGIQLAGVRLSLLQRRIPVSRIKVSPSYLRPPEGLKERIRRERRMLKALLSGVSPFWYPQGGPVMPLRRFKKTTPFGAKRIINGVSVSYHTGVDLAAPDGTPIRAVFKGRVAFAGSLYYTGNTVVLDHGRGFYTLYAHLSSFSVKKGEIVKKGDLLGRVGSTGRATGPHLHLGAYVNGVRVDPLSLFKIPLSLWAVLQG
jgi:murein DD-endopeptidase MepM/ murein hydrolase activator NlpD